MKGYERKGKAIVYRFTLSGSGPESLANLVSDLARPWYKARYDYTIHVCKGHITVTIRRIK